jgi:hypothetical protein
MNASRILLLQRLVLIALILAAWVAFVYLLQAGLARVRQFPGFHHIPDLNSLFAAGVSNETGLEALPLPTQVLSVPLQQSGSILRAQPTSVPAARPAAPQPPRSAHNLYPTKCAHSIETRFAPGDTGYTDPERRIRLRPTPGDDEGTLLAPGTRFVITGNPVCANLYGYSWNNYLWWPVRLTSGPAAGRTGWLAESVIRDGRVSIHLFPD